jgi:alpha-beta hydrolase superfamily lysophospholipase
MAIDRASLVKACVAFFFTFRLIRAWGYPAGDDGSFTERSAEILRKEARPYPASDSSPEMDAYVAHYGLDIEGSSRSWGYARVGGEDLFLQSYEPPEPRGTVLFIHGYMDHGGANGRLFAYIIGRGYSVYAIDLQGHGLSTGERMDIGSFEEYGMAANALRTAALDNGVESEGLIAMGHSTGCAAWLVYLANSGEPPARIVFTAPLVRSSWWGMSKIGASLMGGVKDLKRSNGPRKRRDVFPYAFAEDPLEPESFPMDWARALFAWDRMNASYGPFEAGLTVIQGDADAVVDFRYNIEYLRKRFPLSCDVEMIRGAHHYVLRYSGEAWEAARAVLDRCLPVGRGR